jgi:hypothetical protein
MTADRGNAGLRDVGVLRKSKATHERALGK